MRFAIRDDDTSFYTKPEKLERVWGRILPYAPVSLAITPFALRATHLGDPVRFYQGPDSGPLAENTELTGWIGQHLRAGRVSVMCHGATHEYRRTGPRTLVPEYVWKPADRIGTETIRARRHLEETLGVPVHTFVPPGNGISRPSIEAIRPHFKRLIASVSLRRVSDFLVGSDFAAMAARRVYFQLRYGIVNPFGGSTGGMRLLPSFPITAATEWSELERQFHLCARLGADFIAGVHYWEVHGNVAGILHRLLDTASAAGCDFCPCDALFSAGVAAPATTGQSDTKSLRPEVGQQEGSPAR